MPINEQQILTNIQNRTGYGQKANQDPLTRQQLGFTFSDSKQQLEQQNVELMLPFVLWNDIWNRYGTFGTRRNQLRNGFSGRKYARGRKVFVDFGYNIGREASMKHPAIVVAQFKELLIVAPETSDDGRPFSPDIEKVVIKCPKDGSVFMKDTIVELHQLRCIAKNRIIKDLGVSAKNYVLPNPLVDQLNLGFPRPMLSYGTDLEKTIELKVAWHYAPDVFHHMMHLMNQVEALEEENAELKAQLAELQRPILEAAVGERGEKDPSSGE
ncbi:type II toxin-antitoxin system PemK/MazF family toxin [Cytobacillus sp. FJAT-54145]|uniref:Type II toxin-antitoxin system PemK/MazF family toxin n=1 Tax=Cytobacillus spartinae TaxID=3299023 RepID=A0ABW6KA62_9BACI